MNCQQTNDLLTQFMLGETDADQTAAIQRHLDSGCDVCLRALNELSQSAAILSTDRTSDADASKKTWQLIEEQVSSSVRAVATPQQRLRFEESTLDTLRLGTTDSSIECSPNALRSPESIGVGWRIATTLLSTACSFAIAITLLNQIGDDAIDQHNEERNRSNWAASNNMLTSKTFKASHFRVVSLSSQDEPSVRPGLMIVDRISNQVHFHADDWLTVANGTHYAMWFFTEDEEWIMGLQANAAGTDSQSMVIDIPSSSTPINLISVSLEGNSSENDVHERPADGASFVSDDLGDFFSASM